MNSFLWYIYYKLIGYILELESSNMLAIEKEFDMIYPINAIGYKCNWVYSCLEKSWKFMIT